MTELSPSGTVAPLSAPVQAALSGRPAMGVDLLLTDADGTPLPKQRDVEGHLRVRGASVVERYFGHDTPATDADGWFPTGDLARIDALGNLMITGRAKDLIKSGGEWINPAEIEAVVGALPEVSLAAVIGRSDPKWGERPILLVETKARSATRSCWPRCAAAWRRGGSPTRSIACRACRWRRPARSTRSGCAIGVRGRVDATAFRTCERRKALEALPPRQVARRSKIFTHVIE
jgi:acyl-CoA synthetase (AMP-forming)/AMP-acid ligase II